MQVYQTIKIQIDIIFKIITKLHELIHSLEF